MIQLPRHFQLLFPAFLLILILSCGNNVQAQQTIRCDVCRTKISGQYISYKTDHEHTYACMSCKETKPTCSVCRIPHNRRELTLYRGRELWCVDCDLRANDCALCENPIKGRYFTLNFSEGQWCPDCMKNNDSCFFCQEPYQTAGFTLEEGKHSCPRCNQFAIHGQQNYELLMNLLHPQLEELLGKKFKKIPVKSVTPSQMIAHMQRVRRESGGGSFLDPVNTVTNNPNPGGTSNLGVYTRLGKDRVIMVLDGLPEELAWEVMAHELTHAWQDQHYPGTRDFYLVEGFAQLIAQKICHQNGKVDRLNLLYFRTDDYGHAYRIIQTLEDREGFPAVLNAVTNRSLPEEYQTTPSKEIFRVEF